MKRTSLHKVSKKRSLELREYAKLKAETLPGKRCEFPGCFKPATQVHHIRGRRGKMLNDKRYWVLLCMHCHDWIHNNPNAARGINLLK